MAQKKSATALDASTEDKIKQAARIVFHKKGFAGTRTRDIAEESGINLALLNYYFRSKEKLFELVMLETFQEFFASVAIIFNHPDTSFEEKIERLAAGYIDMLIREPEIPLFLLSEMRNNPEGLIQTLNTKHLVLNSVFARQFSESIQQGKIKDQPFIHFLMNLMGLMVFPFVAKPMLAFIGDLKDEQFRALMEERKKLIPVWIKSILKP